MTRYFYAAAHEQFPPRELLAHAIAAEQAAAVDEFFTDDWHDPGAMHEDAERVVEDDEYRESFIVSADLDEHVERIRQIEELGATTVVLMNVSGDDAQAAIDAYGEHVLPALRSGERVAV